MVGKIISNIAIALSLLIAVLYYGPLVKYRWVFSVALELLPYLSAIAILSFTLAALLPSLRKQYPRLIAATVLLILCVTPILQWVGVPSRSDEPEGIRVMTYNLWIDNPNPTKIEESIRQENPDILFLSEITAAMMSELRSQLDYPYDYRTTGSNNALLSRYPIMEARTDDFGVTTAGRTLNLVATLEINDEPVVLVGIHPPIPIIQNFFHIRNQQLDALAQHIQDIPEKLIVLGDFNATPWSPYMQRFERIGRLKNVARQRWLWATWYFNQTLKTRYIKIPIDHIEVRGFQPLATWTGMTGGSDHKPLITVLEAL